eukprot:TRINITY_DN709_c0_g1_i1.p1 TRINITY_DN709_c0_g1~~TRINITY_DN709_c0_g1_i1.p1  ORF type:complete len:324 (-),score=87.29 TRINITY_DN709_c0_g1_i1:73-987(-)
MVAPLNPSGMCALPPHLLLQEVRPFWDRAQPVGRLACCGRQLAATLLDARGRRLRTLAISTEHFQSALEGLSRTSLDDLEALRVDLSAAKGTERPCQQDAERLVSRLGECLAGASRLSRLAVRLSAFDANMERLRLRSEAWEALVRGLASVARFGRLRSLELSSVTIKASQATRAVKLDAGERRRHLRRAASAPAEDEAAAAAAAAVGAASLAEEEEGAEEMSSATFLQALAQQTGLEDLRLTHAEMFGSTAELLPAALSGMPHLCRVDLSRNHISKQAMEQLCQSLPPHVELSGANQQTFFFY